MPVQPVGAPPRIREVAVPTPECPNPELWNCYDGNGSEIEVLDFLYSLVRMVKPLVAVETGTWFGYGAERIARAMWDNGFGSLHTAEPEERIREKAQRFIMLNQLGAHVTFHKNTGKDMIAWVGEQGPIDFAFLDSNLDTRIGEMKKLQSVLSPRGIVAVHDTNTFHDQHNGPRTPFLKYAYESQMQVINFDTPRGLMLLRRRVG
jgi:predicted O-methyltransferase YrrM